MGSAKSKEKATAKQASAAAGAPRDSIAGSGKAPREAASAPTPKSRGDDAKAKTPPTPRRQGNVRAQHAKYAARQEKIDEHENEHDDLAEGGVDAAHSPRPKHERVASSGGGKHKRKKSSRHKDRGAPAVEGEVEVELELEDEVEEKNNGLVILVPTPAPALHIDTHEASASAVATPNEIYFAATPAASSVKRTPLGAASTPAPSRRLSKSARNSMRQPDDDEAASHLTPALTTRNLSASPSASPPLSNRSLATPGGSSHQRSPSDQVRLGARPAIGRSASVVVGPSSVPIPAYVCGGSGVFLDTWAWQIEIDPFTLVRTASTIFDPSHLPVTQSLLITMDTASLLAPSDSHLEQLWAYFEGGREGMLGKTRLLHLAAEIHARLMLACVQELKNDKVGKWKRVHKALMRERPFLLPPAKIKDVDQLANSPIVSPKSPLSPKSMPPHAPLQMAHLKATAAYLLKTMDLNSDGKISRQEFFTAWQSCTKHFFGEHSKRKSTDGIISCTLM